MAIDDDFDGKRPHSPMGASAAHRWAVCSASVWASKGLPNKSSPWAREGTMGHDVADACLRPGLTKTGKLDPNKFLSAFEFVGGEFEIEGEKLVFESEMARWIDSGIDWIAQQDCDLVELETWLDLTPFIGPNPFDNSPQGGYLDVGFTDFRRKLVTIWDWKFGQEPVAAPNNWQLMLYAAGYRDKYRKILDREGVVDYRIAIEQPRVEDAGGFWYCTNDDLDRFENFIRERAEEVARPTRNRFVPGLKQCRWCLVKDSPKRCAAYDDFMLKALSAKLPDILDKKAEAPKLMKIDLLDPAQKAYLVKHKKALIDWLEQIHASAIDDALRGIEVPGFKLVAGREGNREWVDSERGRAALWDLFVQGAIDDTHTHKMLSPAQTEEEIGKARFKREFGHLVRRGPSKPVLVDESVDKPALPRLVDRLP